MSFQVDLRDKTRCVSSFRKKKIQYSYLQSDVVTKINAEAEIVSDVDEKLKILAGLTG